MYHYFIAKFYLECCSQDIYFSLWFVPLCILWVLVFNSFFLVFKMVNFVYVGFLYLYIFLNGVKLRSIAMCSWSNGCVLKSDIIYLWRVSFFVLPYFFTYFCSIQRCVYFDYFLLDLSNKVITLVSRVCGFLCVCCVNLYYYSFKLTLLLITECANVVLS